jgi:hypothetical protein
MFSMMHIAVNLEMHNSLQQYDVHRPSASIPAFYDARVKILSAIFF